MTPKRVLVYAKYNGCCAYCGSELNPNEFHVDHIYSKDAFKNRKQIIPCGLKVYDLNNLNPACASCNSVKYNYSVDEFRLLISQRLKLERENNAKIRIAEKLGLVIFSEFNVVFYFEKIKDKQNG